MQPLILDHEEFAEVSTWVLGCRGTLCFAARGHSMWPAIRGGDELTAVRQSSEEIAVGDVVLYRAPAGRLVAHRVVARDVREGKVWLRTAGDAYSYAHEEVSPGQVLGLVTGLRRGGREGPLVPVPSPSWLSGVLNPGTGAGVRSALQGVRWCVRRSQRLALYRQLGRRFVRSRLRLRVAGPRDAMALAGLYPETPVPPGHGPGSGWRAKLVELNAVGCVVVAELDGRIAGVTMATRIPHNERLYPGWWCQNTRVRLSTRGLGVGEALVRESVRLASDRGACELHALISERNRPSLALYEKIGFRPAKLPALEKELEQQRGPSDPRYLVFALPIMSDRGRS